jgi:hypothetical protein
MAREAQDCSQSHSVLKADASSVVSVSLLIVQLMVEGVRAPGQSLYLSFSPRKLGLDDLTLALLLSSPMAAH